MILISIVFTPFKYVVLLICIATFFAIFRPGENFSIDKREKELNKKIYTFAGTIIGICLLLALVFAIISALLYIKI